MGRRTWESSYLSVDWRQPIDWNHRLNESLQVYLLASPHTSYGTTWRNLTNRTIEFTGTNTEQTDWDVPTGAQRQGGWSCVNLGGTNEIFLLSSTPITAYPVTITAWARLANITATMSMVQIIDEATGANYLSLVADGGNEYAADNQVVGDIGGGSDANSGGTYAASTWFHAAITMQVATVGLVAYKDGATSGTPFDTAGKAASGWNRIAVGSFFVGGSHFGPTTGQIDAVRIYSRVLSAGEIAELYELEQNYSVGLLNRRRRVTYFVPAAPVGGNRRRRFLMSAR